MKHPPSSQLDTQVQVQNSSVALRALAGIKSAATPIAATEAACTSFRFGFIIVIPPIVNYEAAGKQHGMCVSEPSRVFASRKRYRGDDPQSM
jgi:hypothetical protein